MIRRPPRSTLCPSTTLVRSLDALVFAYPPPRRLSGPSQPASYRAPRRRKLTAEQEAAIRAEARSEEHTSELQSRQYLVCRLLLEKKNIIPPHAATVPPLAAR